MSVISLVTIRKRQDVASLPRPLRMVLHWPGERDMLLSRKSRLRGIPASMQLDLSVEDRLKIKQLIVDLNQLREQREIGLCIVNLGIVKIRQRVWKRPIAISKK